MRRPATFRGLVTRSTSGTCSMRSRLSTICPSSPEFAANAAHMSQVLAEFRAASKQAMGGGSAKAIALHRSRKKLLVRERIEALLDPGSPFMELTPMAGWHPDPKKFNPSAGIVTGIGVVSGRLVMIVGNDPTVKGGTYVPLTIKKHLRAQKVAMENHLPCLYLVESGGGNLTMDPGDGSFADESGFGRIFYNQARLSAMGCTQIAVVLGSCTAGGAYVPAMSDEVVIVRGNGTIFLAGPPLVKAATGEVVTAEELGGGEVHCQISGVADHLAEDEPDALRMARSIVANLGPARPPSLARCSDPILPPRFPAEELHGLVPADPKQPMDMRGILDRLLDDSRLDEFKAEFGETLITGFGRIDGYQVGIVANAGTLFSDASVKGAHFVQLCARRGVPLVFLQNISGFMVGKDAEHGGIAKHGAKLVHAVSCADVPKFTVVVGGSFGAGNYGMCGRAYSPRFMWMWPNAKIAVMAGENAASVLMQVKLAAAKKAGVEVDKAEMAKMHLEFIQRFDATSSAAFASGHLWDDGIIEPTETRHMLSLALSVAANAPAQDTRFGVFRM